MLRVRKKILAALCSIVPVVRVTLGTGVTQQSCEANKHGGGVNDLWTGSVD